MITKMEVIRAANAKLSHLLGVKPVDWVGSWKECAPLMTVFRCQPRAGGVHSAQFVGFSEEDKLVRLNVVLDAIARLERTLCAESDLFDVVTALPDTCAEVAL